MHPILTSLLGIAAILGLAFLLSTGKRRIKLRVVGAAFALQALMALLAERTDKRLARHVAEDSFIPTGPAYAAPLPSRAGIVAAARRLLEVK